MKSLSCLGLFVLLGVSSLTAEISWRKYDPEEVQDPSTLETKVLQDWKASPRDPAVRQKLIEITIGEWFPGAKVRLPVTLNAPVSGPPCTCVIVSNQSLAVKPALPSGAMLRLLKEHGVGIVLIGMDTVDAMAPDGSLSRGMKENLLRTHDPRYAPAWIWGLSDMRALTSACAESTVFKPEKVLATGGSKRGVGAAAAGLHDIRFTAIMPVVAPILWSPGGPYVEGTLPANLAKINDDYIAGLPKVAHDSLVYRQKVRADERITVAEARTAGWTDKEMAAMSQDAWAVSRVTQDPPYLGRRNLEIFFNNGTNDNVSPGALELGRVFPNFPHYLMPGGQHGGAKEAGFNHSVASQPEVDENLYSFAMHHFFAARPWVSPPKITSHLDPATRILHVTATFEAGIEPQKNDLWYSVDRHPDYTLPFEFDTWASLPLQRVSASTFTADLKMESHAKTLDFLTVHRHEVNGLPVTFSSPLLRAQ